METEKKFVHDGLGVRYKFRPAGQDRRHLIVVFSGFRPKGSAYDFDGRAAEGLRANILWIRDDFDGEQTYYIKSKNGYGPAEAVAALIDELRARLGLEKEHCTLVGFSKGGTGALYHALAHDYPNVLMTVPRMHIGTGNIGPRPHLVEAMAGSRSAEAVRELDGILPGLLAADTNPDRNIYLFSSEKDAQFRTEIEPFLGSYSRYLNFNFIKTDSPLVARHVDVTPYNVPMVISILHALGEGIFPRFGAVENGASAFSGKLPAPSLATVRERSEVASKIDTLAVHRGLLSLSGHILRKGTPVSEREKREVSVRLESPSCQIDISLVPAQERKLSYRYFENEFCDYGLASFVSSGSSRDSLEDLEPGSYVVSLHVAHGDGAYASTELELPEKVQTSAHGGYLYQFRQFNDTVILVKRPAIGPAPDGTLLVLKKHWAKESKLHIEGDFLVPGHPVPHFDAVKFFLSLQPESAECSAVTVRVAAGTRRLNTSVSADPYLDYSKSYFSTRKYKGIELAGLKPGTYELWMAAEFPNAAVVSRPLGLVLDVDHQGGLAVSEPVRVEMAPVAIIPVERKEPAKITRRLRQALKPKLRAAR